MQQKAAGAVKEAVDGQMDAETVKEAVEKDNNNDPNHPDGQMDAEAVVEVAATTRP